jgi:hypothetical protein
VEVGKSLHPANLGPLFRGEGDRPAVRSASPGLLHWFEPRGKNWRVTSRGVIQEYQIQRKLRVQVSAAATRWPVRGHRGPYVRFQVSTMNEGHLALIDPSGSLGAVIVGAID